MEVLKRSQKMKQTNFLVHCALLALIMLAPGLKLRAQCESHFHHSALPGSTTVAFVNASQDSGSFQSFWYFGDGSNSMAINPIHTYAQGGTYLVCLTIYNPQTQCTDTECKLVSVMNQPPCKAYFKIKPDSTVGPNAFRFQDLSQSQSNIIQWNWNFGDGGSSNLKNPLHQYQAPGPYQVCLNIMSQDSCQDSYCMTFHVGAQGQYHLGGQVFAGTNLLDDFQLILYRHTGYTIQAIDTLAFDTLGFYYFVELPSGPYFMRAEPQPGSQFYNTYLPTYQGDEILWTHGQAYQHQGLNFGADIHMKALTPPASGPGRIAGRVFPTNGFPLPPGPLPRVTMILFDAQWTPRAFTYTNPQGFFSFNQLATGSYNVYPELAGIPGHPAYVSISSSSPMADSVNFSLGLTLNSVSDVSAPLQFSVYPNPFMDMLYVESVSGATDKDLKIELVSPTGRIVTSQNIQPGSNRISLSLHDVAAGLYFLQIRSKQDLLRVEKVIKQ
jgi:PKD repeat protein